MKPSERKKLLMDVQAMILIADDVKVRFQDRLGTIRQELDGVEKELLDPNSPWFGPFKPSDVAEDVPEAIKALDVACNGTGLMERAVGRLERSEFQRMRLTLEFGL